MQSSDGQTVVTEATTTATVDDGEAGSDTSSAASLLDDVESDDLFSAGARVDLPDELGLDVDEDAAEAAAEPDATESADTDEAAPPDVSSTEPSPSAANAEPSPSAGETSDGATREAEAAPAPTEAPTTTAAPTTAAPTTEAPTTAAPTTEAPTTTAAPTTVEVPTTQAAPAEAPATEAPAGEPTPEQWEKLRQCESGGDYTIVSSNGLYHGAYQFHQDTWNGVANSIGRTDLVGVPPEVVAAFDQDTMALALWRQRGSQPWPVCGKHLPPGP